MIYIVKTVTGLGAHVANETEFTTRIQALIAATVRSITFKTGCAYVVGLNGKLTIFKNGQRIKI